MVRNIELFMQLCDSSNLSRANHKSNMTGSHSSTLLKTFQVYGLLKFRNIEGKKIFYAPTDKGKLVYNCLLDIRKIINEQRPIGEFAV